MSRQNQGSTFQVSSAEDFDETHDEPVTTKVDSEEARRKRKLQKICKKALKFLLSTVGLLIINGAYIVAGGFIFEHLEKGNEQAGCENGYNDYVDAENATLTLLMDMATRLEDVGNKPANEKKDIQDEFQKYIRAFSISVLSAGHDVSVNCSLKGTPDGTEYDWSWTGSVVFAVTVVTTIGYGHISPATTWGRVVCIAYALIGIPIMMMCLATVGDILATLFRLFYGTICCCGCFKKAPQPEPQDPEAGKKKTLRIGPDGRPIMEEEDENVVTVEEGEEDDEDEENEELTVPLTITIGLMAAFILVGAYLFSFWEEWLLVDSIYFCFTTLTTIGFGDLVPGTNLDSAGAIFQSMAAILYIIFGMALISMCFQLMSDEVVAKFQWIGDKLSSRKKAREEAEAARQQEQEDLMDDNQ